MDRAYAYNNVRSLLAVFVALEVLNNEDKKNSEGERQGNGSEEGMKGDICASSTMLKERGKWIQLRFNIPNIPENKRNAKRVLKQSLLAFKLFQQRFNIVSTRFNNLERAWQTLSTLPFNKIERMLKQMLNYPPNIFWRRNSYIFCGFFRVSLCGIGEEHFISPSLASAKSLVFLDQLKV